ncbi:hypothetical protein BZB76_1057 [Actinomadura pelletieri DSM 43383]|uniref:Uncharacterized protein n=1 Tax=Actinomadura pelletieri DSM 43383 TaxID=1120940 RepID=A0A495QZG2_9ACTN|nr:hypothetical protein [Actinomadura pelletieri]RKS79583.1 hypothetical protein BZB76_1057 [Actinomadura pelletieri DSM 43383]
MSTLANGGDVVTVAFIVSATAVLLAALGMDPTAVQTITIELASLLGGYAVGRLDQSTPPRA